MSDHRIRSQFGKSFAKPILLRITGNIFKWEYDDSLGVRRGGIRGGVFRRRILRKNRRTGDRSKRKNASKNRRRDPKLPHSVQELEFHCKDILVLFRGFVTTLLHRRFHFTDSNSFAEMHLRQDQLVI
jgi:hypothetical protein